LNIEVEGADVEVIKYLADEIQDHKLKFLMVSFKAFNLLIQESYNVKRSAYARSQEPTNRMLRKISEIITETESNTHF
jgi:hypothetical protein